MRLQLVAATILFIGLIAAPVSVDAQTSNTVEGYICTGSEHGDECFQPLPDAAVQLVGDGVILSVGAVDESTTSDKGGYFAFSEVPDGEYTLSISRAGFESVAFPVSAAGGSFESYYLMGAELEQTGSVVDVNGPVSSAYLYFYGEDYADATTDRGGEFAVQIRGGYYQISVDQRVLVDGCCQSFLIDGTPLELEVQEIKGRDIPLSGTITDQNGVGIAGVRVNVDQCCNYYPYYQEETAPDGVAYSEPYYGGYQSTETDASGKYSLMISEGWYNLNAYKDGYARAWADGEATSSGVTEDLKMEKFPDKTAVIKGKIMDSAGKGLGDVSISISNEKYGQYECSTYEEYADKEADYEWGCKIIVNKDGSFEAKVMPGYSIVSVYYDHWRGCNQSHNGDGSSSTSCGPNYYQASKVIDFQAGTEHEVNIRLQQRPGPDAVISGYVLDEEGEGITNGRISFNRLDGYSYAWADLDMHGSYKLAVQSGYYSVSVYADGYFRWEGNILIKADSDTPLDIVLTEGTSSYGYCCYAYEGGLDYAEGSDGMIAKPASGSAQGEAISSGQPGQQSDSGDEGFQNLGGLGPYDKQKRNQELADASETPPIGLLLVVAGLLGLARRRQF